MRRKPSVTRGLAGLCLAGIMGIAFGAILAAFSLLVPLGRQTAVVAEAQPPAVSGSEPAAAGPAVAAPTLQPAAVSQPEPTTPALTRRVTILVMGVDNRPNEPVGRTDTIMLLTVDPRTGSSGIISLARDLLVPVPGMKQKVKINTAHVLGETSRYPGGGPALLTRTVEDFLGYPVDYWVRIDLQGFRQIIDQIGGIDIDVPKAINDPLYPNDSYGYDPLYIPAGHIHMNGDLALKYARVRHVDSDYGRARRQQQVVKAVKDKLMQPGNLAALLPKLPGLASTLSRSVQTNMPVTKALELARQFSQLGLGDPKSVVIDDAMGTNGSDPTWGFVLIPNMEKVHAAAASVFADPPVEQAAAPSQSAGN